jgi:hypothetical protein
MPTRTLTAFSVAVVLCSASAASAGCLHHDQQRPETVTEHLSPVAVYQHTLTAGPATEARNIDITAPDLLRCENVGD